MEEQAAAERQRRATDRKRDGQRQAAIAETDGRLEASRRDARPRVRGYWHEAVSNQFA